MATSSLFGETPETIRQQQAAALDAQAMKYAEMDPFQRATYGIYKGANQLGGAIGGMLGGTDPQMAKASQRQEMLKGLDQRDPQSWIQLARKAQEAGDYAGAQEAAAQAAALEKAAQEQQLKLAQMSKANAEAQVIVAQARRNAAFTAGMAALPENATNKDMIKLAMATGSQSDVLKVIEMSDNKEAARAQALAIFKEKQAAEALRLQELGVQKATAQAQLFQQQQFMAQLTASLKGPPASKPLAPMLQRDENNDLKIIDDYTAQQKGLAAPIANLTPDANGVRKLELGPINNAMYKAQNAAGKSTPTSLMYAELKSAVDTAINVQVSNENGVQTDKDVLRFADALVGAYGRNDSKATLDALKLFNGAAGEASTRVKSRVESRRRAQKVGPYGFSSTAALGTSENPIKLD